MTEALKVLQAPQNDIDLFCRSLSVTIQSKVPIDFVEDLKLELLQTVNRYIPKQVVRQTPQLQVAYVPQPMQPQSTATHHAATSMSSTNRPHYMPAQYTSPLQQQRQPQHQVAMLPPNIHYDVVSD